MRKAEIAAFLNQKGGVGKTTSVVNIASGLTILGKKVLVVDLDPQAHLTRNFGIDEENIKHSIFDVLRGHAELHQSLVEKELGARFIIDGNESALSVTVAPANLDLTGAEIFLSRLRTPEYALKRAFERNGYDFDHVLIDCPPSLGLLTTNALVASHKVYIPVQTEFLALESLSNLQKTIEKTIGELNPALEIGGLIATRFDGRKVLSRTVVETMKERFGSLLLESIIRENIVLAEAPSVGKDIFSYRPRSHGAQDYLNLCREILDGNNYTDATITVDRGRVITSHAGFLESWD
jgi:chromosome partitioning protein